MSPFDLPLTTRQPIQSKTSSGLANLGLSLKVDDSKLVDCVQYQRVHIQTQGQHLILLRSSLATRDSFPNNTS